MLRAYKYRLYPTGSQSELLSKHFGCCRFVYNLGLEVKNNAYATHRKQLSVFDLIGQLTDLKKECDWLKEVDSQSLQQSLVDLDKAFTGFFKGYSSFPKFKKKFGKQSFRNPHGSKVKIENGRLVQPKFREGIKVVIDREPTGKIKSTTISRTPTGKYYVSVLCETGVSEPAKPAVTEGGSVGIDLGLSHFVITSEGIKVENPRHLHSSLERLRVLQRRASRKKKGSANRRKANRRVSVLHERIGNQRKDFLHKVSSELINNHDSVCVETLQVSEMMKNDRLSQSIADVSWGSFVEMLEYKSNWYGKNVLKIPTFQPSTKLCSVCGTSKRDLTLADREWTCGKCGVKHDRDINAAINIRNYCIRNSGEGIPVGSAELPTLVGTVKQESQKVNYINL